VSFDLHRRSESLAGDADVLMAAGRAAEARLKYLEAARLEADSFTSVPAERPRTRGVVATSAVALHLKADAPEEGLRLARRLLAVEPDLPEFAIRDIEDLIDDLRLARDFHLAGQTVVPGAYECVLDGPRIWHGLAPADAVVQKIEQVSRYGIRVFEYVSHMPLRRGPIEAHLRARFGLLMAQPTAGSFRFQLRFSSESQQLDLTMPTGSPETQVPSVFGSILEAATQPDAGNLKEIVADESYRLVFLKLVRNLAPSGPDINRIELRPVGPVGAATVLTPSTARSLGQYISRTTSGARTKERTVQGYLRAIHLNEDWIGVGPKEGPLERLGAAHDLVEDTLSGLIDRRVSVQLRRQRNAWVVTDVTEAPEGGAEPTPL
jgi:hypothetical protein